MCDDLIFKYFGCYYKIMNLKFIVRVVSDLSDLILYVYSTEYIYAEIKMEFVLIIIAM